MAGEEYIADFRHRAILFNAILLHPNNEAEVLLKLPWLYTYFVEMFKCTYTALYVATVE